MAYFEPAAGAELPPLSREITQAKINRYAMVSGDGNPIHIDPEFASRSAFRGPVAHGMLVLAYVSEMLAAAFGQDWPRSGRLKIRFRGPARPGDTVTASGRIEKLENARAVCAIECRNQDGEVLISGDAAVSLSAKGQS